MDPLGALARALGYCTLTVVLFFVVDVSGTWSFGCNDVGGGPVGSHCVREHPHGYVLAPIAAAVVVLVFIVAVEYWLMRRRRRG